MTATSNETGIVSFTNIPSGHIYTLTETGVPEGYYSNGRTYSVQVAYDEVAVTVSNGGTSEEWEGKIQNFTSYKIPETGGGGTYGLYAAGGLLLAAGALLLYSKKRREGDEGN